MAKRPQLTPEQIAERRIGRENGLRNGYAAGAIAMAARLLRPGDVAFDLGANRGEITAVLAPSGATIHAYEPDPDCFDALSARFAATDNVQLFQKAVGDQAGTARFFRHNRYEPGDKTSEAGTIVSGNNNVNYNKAGIEVEIVDFTDVLAAAVATHGKIALIKMDIEGSEVGLLRKLLATDLLDHVGVLLVETHEQQYPALAKETVAVKEEIAARFAPTHVYTDWI